MKIAVLLVTLLLMSCVRTYMVPQSVIDQQITREKLVHNQTVSLISVLTVPLGVIVSEQESGRSGNSGLSWLTAIDKKGDTVEVEIDQNSQFIITTKAQETVKMYATTAFIESGVLKGRRSRIIGMAREVPLDSIGGISLYTENSNVRQVLHK